eukprot:358909-Chlamydomonas_euryale.AAC.1
MEREREEGTAHTERGEGSKHRRKGRWKWLARRCGGEYKHVAKKAGAAGVRQGRRTAGNGGSEHMERGRSGVGKQTPSSCSNACKCARAHMHAAKQSSLNVGFPALRSAAVTATATATRPHLHDRRARQGHLAWGRRAAHARFNISIDAEVEVFCQFEGRSALATVLREAKPYVPTWDETHVSHEHNIEAADRSLLNLYEGHEGEAWRAEVPFAGNVMVLFEGASDTSCPSCLGPTVLAPSLPLSRGQVCGPSCKFSCLQKKQARNTYGNSGQRSRHYL